MAQARMLVLLALLIGATMAQALVARPASTTGILALSSRNNHTCVLMADGRVLCWGANDVGQLGDGTLVAQPTPMPVQGIPGGVIALAAGYEHTCALTAGGGVWCWGGNGNGQLGDGTVTGHLLPAPVSGLSSGVVAIASGDFHTCAIMSSDGLKCWGDDAYGQIGDGAVGDRLVPTDACADASCTTLLSGVADVAAGYLHTCAAFSDGSAKCWGHGTEGRLGNGQLVDTFVPVDVCADASCTVPLTDVVAIAAGQRHSCAVTAAGGVKCWGRNTAGQLGDGENSGPELCGPPGLIACSSTPVEVLVPTSDITQIDASVDHNCVATEAERAYCWGSNFAGQLGNATTDLSSVPVQPIGLDTAVAAVAAGSAHSCALSSNDVVRCWGANGFGQVGDGTADDRNVPTGVVSLSPKPAPTPSPTATLSITATPTRTATPTPLPPNGDVNGDGATNSLDALLALQFGARLITSLPRLDNGDVNLDGSVTAIDAALILQYDAGLLSHLPV